MEVTVRSLLGIPDAGLVVASGEAGLDAEVRWVHTSEVYDPTPWLRGGEFLLTTGLHLSSDDSMTAYIERLHDHGLVGLGFGTGGGILHRDIPAPVLEASERLGFPVLEVPFDTPFIMITEFVSAQRAEERYRVAQLAYKAQQQLTHMALSDDAIGGLVARLAELTGGWAIVTNSNGDVLDASPSTSVAHIAALEADLSRVLETASVVSVTDAAGRSVSIHPLGATGKVRGMLLLGQEAQADVYERMIAASATSLLSFVIEQRMSLSPQRMAAANLLGDTLLDPDTSRERFTRAAAGLGIDPQATLILARLSVADTAAATVAEVLHDAFSRHGGMSITVRDRDRPDVHTLIAYDNPENHAALDRLDELFADAPVRVGAGDPVRLSRLHLAYNQASLALSHARRRGDPRIVRFHELQNYDRIIGLAPPATVTDFVATVLAPLERLEASGRPAELIETLRAYLACHGRWDPAAQMLGIHRQTLIKRVARIEKYLDVDLDSPDARMGLWFALAARDAERVLG